MLPVPIFRLVYYLRYLFRAKSRHGIHSPFVYRLVEEVLSSLDQHIDYSLEEKLNAFKNDHRVLDVMDFKSGNHTATPLSKIAKRSTSTRRFRTLMRSLIAHFEIDRAIETGTSLGFCAAYMATARESVTVHTIEGNPAVMSIAQDTFGHLDNIHFHAGDIHRLFGPLAEKICPGLVFLDADHRGSTIDYYLKALQPVMKHVRVIVIHDIYWSPDMLEAWNRHYPNYPIAIDLYQAGLLFPQIDCPHQHFYLKC